MKIHIVLIKMVRGSANKPELKIYRGFQCELHFYFFSHLQLFNSPVCRYGWKSKQVKGKKRNNFQCLT